MGLVALGHACSSGDRAKPFSHGGGGGDASATGGSGGLDTGLMDGPPSPDATGLCGNTVIPVITEKPNVYFVVDRSGSMADPLPNSPYVKYEGARIAIAKVLRAIGHRLRYGAAVFPANALGDCVPGTEIFPTQDGDPPTYAASGKDGPVLKKLLTVLGGFKPNGGTPTSPTLDALSPVLTALPGKTFVVLATDGGPNCNPNASCTIDECMPNIEGACPMPVSCCDPKYVTNGPELCVDRQASVDVLGKLHDAGIKTYVIGMPGAEIYTNVLDEMATAGGTAKLVSPYYYPVQDEAQLTAALKEIGIKVSISCTVDLGSAPPDENLVNVYLDTSLVQLDPVDGWSWTSDSSLELYGAACDKLKSGDVLQVQVVAGCPTSVK